MPSLRAEDPSKDGSIPLPLKAAAVLIFFLAGALAFHFLHRTPDLPPEPQPSIAETGVDRRGRNAQSNRIARVRVRRTEKTVMEEEGAAAPDIARAGEEEILPQAAENHVETAADDGEKPVAAPRPRGRKQRVVFTDGKKIVRRSGGVVEVPRVFSCAGAGVKPFWVYGANPEAEAAKELKAREEWQELARQAGESL